MQKPTLKYERSLWKRGYAFVAGLDEVGVGSLAGPVLVGCVICKKGFSLKNSPLARLRDSKSLTKLQREYFARLLKNHPQIMYTTARVYPTVIDKINIFQAARLAMQRAVLRIQPKPSFLLIDGAALLKRNALPQKAIVKGDKKIFSIAAASVLAKVARDRIMRRWSKRLPGYGFERHKGYATRLHYKALRKLGLSKIHRLSFLS